MITPVVAFDEIDSTNAEARRRAEAGERGPLWLTAAVQTAGRGRRGRVWETVTGNLAATYLFTTPKPPAEAAQVSFVAALAAWDLATQSNSLPPRSGGSTGEAGVGGPSARKEEPPTSRARRPEPLPPYRTGAEKVIVTLKWPNDLLLNGRKAGGILVESGQGPNGLWVAVGMGINLAVAPDPAANAAIVPTSFHAEGLNAPPPPEALAVLGRSIDTWLTVWTTEGFPAIAAAWTSRAHGLGHTCTARLPTETVIGIAEGLDGDGALRLRLDGGGIRRVTAGDVFFGETI